MVSELVSSVLVQVLYDDDLLADIAIEPLASCKDEGFLIELFLGYGPCFMSLAGPGWTDDPEASRALGLKGPGVG